MNALLHIPARGGSKGLPGKNLLRVGAASLVGRAVLSGRMFLAEHPDVDGTVFVDTDSEEIAEGARGWGAEVPFLRSPELATDTSATVDVVLHALSRFRESGRAFDAVVLLQPTSPLRTPDDVAKCWETFAPPDRPSVISTIATRHPLKLALRAKPQGTLAWAAGDPGDDLRRQGSETAYWPSGAVYVAHAQFLRERKAFIVPGITVGVELSAATAVDVDTQEDVALASAIAAATQASPIAIGDRLVGSGQPCFIIAEAAIGHIADAERAHAFIDEAGRLGADAIKFQTIDLGRLASNYAAEARDQTRHEVGGEAQLEMLGRQPHPTPIFTSLRDHATEAGITFLSSSRDTSGATLAETLGVPVFRVPSDEITNYGFLRRLARQRKPMLISTAMCTPAEVGNALVAIRSTADVPVALLHCAASEPAAPGSCNLRAIGAMESLFKVPVGWSDQAPGIDLALAAVAAGAHMIEKPLTLDRTRSEREHRVSLEPVEFFELIQAVRRVESSMGVGERRP